MQPIALGLFGKLAKTYERVLDYATLYQDRYWKRLMVQKTHLTKKDLVLDVGCGTLLLEQRLLEVGCEVVGLDLTREMLNVGLSKRLSNVPLLVNGDAEFLPFADDSFDVVVSCYVPKYVDIGKFARELGRVVKPRGKVAMYDFVKPRGAFSLLLDFYTKGGIRIAGFILEKARNQAGSILSKLPSIVDDARWDREIVKVMESKGFETGTFEHLTLGAVSAYYGTKLPEKTGRA
ncbi:MAG: class I SAM-dependent methyltransferase [Thaumarchaeota archaeon]|nr:class I SAM-dependent methyltransferase [Nitrososphaerota archaeon]